MAYKKRPSQRNSPKPNPADAAAKVLPFQFRTAAGAEPTADMTREIRHVCRRLLPIAGILYIGGCCKTMEYSRFSGVNTPCCFRIDSAVCPLDLAGAQASGANIDVAGRTLHDCFDALDIGLPCTVGTTVRVRDLNTKSNALAADFAFCHSWHLLYRLVNKIYCNRNRKKNQALFSDS